MTQLIHHNQHSQYPKKQKKWLKTQKQVIQQPLVVDDRRFKDEKTERNRIDL